jgi:hypothetical protein
MNDPKNDDIDIAWADSQDKYHWLHPAVRFCNAPRLLAIRAKHRARYLQRQREERAKRDKQR